jgi:hypothetical protein
MNNNDIKSQLKLLNNQLNEVNKQAHLIIKKIEVLKEECKHEELDINDYGSATCLICGKYFDWYCPTSPTLECDYEQEDGSWDYDYCRYCGEPEERK